MKKNILFIVIGIFLFQSNTLAQKEKTKRDTPESTNTKSVSTSYDSHTVLNFLQLGVGSAEGLVSDGNGNFSNYDIKGKGNGIMGKMVFTIQTDSYIQFEAMGFLGQYLLNNWNGVYSNSLLEMAGGWTINRKSPLHFGGIDMRFGLGLNGGIRAFKAGDLTYNKLGQTAFFGPSIHSFTNIGKKFQIFNTNEFGRALVYTTGTDINWGGRMKFDFVCTYRIFKGFGIAITPSIEIFNQEIFNGENEIGKSRYNYKYIQIGITFID